MIPTCSSCRFFVLDEPEIIDTLTHDDGSIEEIINDEEIDSGTCHRHAPQPTMYCFLPAQTVPLSNIVFDIGDAIQLIEQEALATALAKLEALRDQIQASDPDTTTIWPAVDAEDYCGEFKMIDRKGKK